MHKGSLIGNHSIVSPVIVILSRVHINRISAQSGYLGPGFILNDGWVITMARTIMTWGGWTQIHWISYRRKFSLQAPSSSINLFKVHISVFVWQRKNMHRVCARFILGDSFQVMTNTR